MCVILVLNGIVHLVFLEFLQTSNFYFKKNVLFLMQILQNLKMLF